MKTKIIFILTGIVLVVTIFFVILRKTNQDTSPDLSDNERKMLELFEFLNTNKFDYWGKVVDLEGNPIKGANVRIYVDRNYNYWDTEDQTFKEINLTTDHLGKFKLINEIGGRVSVTATKERYDSVIGYENIGQSSSSETYFYDDHNLIHNKIPTKEDPVILVLRKKNPYPNIAKEQAFDKKISKTGEVTNIALNPGEKEIIFEITSFADAPNPFEYIDFDWSVQIKVLDAKIQKSADFEPFEAPNSGYVDSLTISNILGKNHNGKNGAWFDLWIQFLDGSYAKATIGINMGRKQEIDIELIHNLDGDRNFDL